MLAPAWRPPGPERTPGFVTGRRPTEAPGERSGAGSGHSTREPPAGERFPSDECARSAFAQFPRGMLAAAPVDEAAGSGGAPERGGIA